MPKFRVLTLSGGKLKISDGEADARPPAAGEIRWVELEAQDEPSLKLVGERFNFHPLTIEDCAHFDQRPKVEEYGEYLFVVTHVFVCPSSDPREVEPLELHTFLGPGYIVTVHEKPLTAIEDVWKRAGHDALLVKKGADFLHYMVIDEMVDANFPILDLISEKLEEIEDAVLGRPSRQELGDIFQLKRSLTAMRRILSPERDVFGLLAKGAFENGLISDRTSVYYRDVYDHLVRIYESIDTGRDLLGNALDAYLSMVAQRTNDIMKRLTVLSAVFLPISFVTGFFGQNFDALPIHHAWIFYMVCGICLAVPAGMVLWFWRSKWL
jgi:magnesium transporter